MRFIWELIRLVFNKRFTTLAGAISFFFLINGGTAIFLAVLILQSLNIDIVINESAYIPKEIMEVIKYFLETPNHTDGYSIFFIATSVWGASNTFFQMIQTGEMIYEKRRKQTGSLKRAIAILFMLIFIFLFVGSWFLLTFLQNWINHIQYGFISVFTKNLVLFLLPFLLLLYINVWIPPIVPSVKKAIPGTLFTTIYWFTASYLFGIYVRHFSNLNQLYGALTFVLTFMLWLYIMTNGLIIGFIINFKIQNKEGKE